MTSTSTKASKAATDTGSESAGNQIDTSTATTLPGSTTKTPDTGTLSPQPSATAAPTGTLSRNDATRVMTAIDELRKRTVREIRALNASIKRQPDQIKDIELGQKNSYLTDLGDLHKVVGEAFSLGGY